MEEKVLQTRFGDVNIAQFDIRRRGQAGDFRDEGAAAVGVEIGCPMGIAAADLPYSAKGLEPLQQVGRMVPEAKTQKISAGNGSLQFLGSADG